MKTITTEKLPIISWCNNPEEGAIEQAKDLANLPILHSHVALMPDTHQGYGMPIGGVIAVDHDKIIPNAVGVDIGCGMIAVKTSIRVADFTQDHLKQIFGGSKDFHGGIRTRIPLGMTHHKKDQEWSGFNEAPDIPVVQDNIDNARKSLGTLGGGNHFIEVQAGDDGKIWIMLHSGSRNLGYTIAKHFHNLAQGETKNDLAHLNTTDGIHYFYAMEYALKFALENRKRMMDVCMDEFIRVFGTVAFDKPINIHHNYAAIEKHNGEYVMIHRKGATSARKGELGIIPGSQGTKSYIVQGKGNPLSWNSCSHGAGRTMSRTQAIKTLDYDEEVKAMDDKGILHSIRGKKTLDEAPSAYKDIDTVMSEQSDLVDILVELTPLGCIKG